MSIPDPGSSKSQYQLIILPIGEDISELKKVVSPRQVESTPNPATGSQYTSTAIGIESEHELSSVTISCTLYIPQLSKVYNGFWEVLLVGFW